MEERDGAKSVVEVVSATSVIAENAPTLEPGDRVLDTCSALAMTPPRAVADDATVAKCGRDELGDAAIAAVGKDSAMALAELLDERAAVVDRIVAIPGSARGAGDDAEVAASDQDLRIARVPVVLRFRSTRVIAGRNQRPVDDPRDAAITRRWIDECGE